MEKFQYIEYSRFSYAVNCDISDRGNNKCCLGKEKVRGRKAMALNT
jgi:hypothetical protein